MTRKNELKKRIVAILPQPTYAEVAEVCAWYAHGDRPAKLTKKQTAYYDYVIQHRDQHGVPPSYYDLVRDLKASSASHAYFMCRHFRHLMKGRK